MLCPFCMEEIQDGAIKCKHCGSMIVSLSLNHPPLMLNKQGKGLEKKGTVGLAIASMVIGILAVLACLDVRNMDMDSDTINGSNIFCLLGLGLGIGSLYITKSGRRMAIAGIALNSLAQLILIKEQGIARFLIHIIHNGFFK